MYYKIPMIEKCSYSLAFFISGMQLIQRLIQLFHERHAGVGTMGGLGG